MRCPPEDVSRILCRRPPEVSTTPSGYTPFPRARLSAQLLLTRQHSLPEPCQTPCPIASAALSFKHESLRWESFRSIGQISLHLSRTGVPVILLVDVGGEDVKSLKYIEIV